MLAADFAVAVLVLMIGTLGLSLAVFDRVPRRPRWLYHALVRRRRDVLFEYPPGLARVAGAMLLLYCLGLILIAINLTATLSGSSPPGWSGYGGWPVLMGMVGSIYVMLRLRLPSR
jgi:hypothetical protein